MTYCDMMGLAITDLTAIIAANNLEWAQEKAAQVHDCMQSPIASPCTSLYLHS